MSDLYDDDDDFFDNPETLNLLVQVEERALQASQAQPKASQLPLRHDTVATDNYSNGRPELLGTRRTLPQPQNATSNTRSQWKPPVPAGVGGSKSGHAEDEPPPIDIVMDGTGRYGLANPAGSSEEAVVTDNRRSKSLALGARLGLGHGRSGSASSIGTAPRGSQGQDGRSAASEERRRAITQALSGGDGGKVLSRSNSTSSITASRPSHAPAAPGQTSAPPPPHRGSHAFNPTRQLSRSASVGSHAGSQVFGGGVSNRPSPLQGNVRLLPIPSGGGSQGSQNQGYGNNQAEGLKKERERRVALEMELARLRAGAGAAANPILSASVSTNANSSNAQKVRGGAEADDLEKKIKELQAQMWAAKGEAETIRRAQKEEKDRFKAELERLQQAVAEKEAQVKEKEIQSKRMIETVRHQAIFTNHAIQASAVKPRPQASQRASTSSQFPRHLPTPARGNSTGLGGGGVGGSHVNATPLRGAGLGMGPAGFGADPDVTPLARGARESHNRRPLLGHTPGRPSSDTQGHATFYNAFAATPKLVTSVAGSRKKLKTSHETDERNRERERSSSQQQPSPSRSQPSQALPTRSQLLRDGHSSPTSPKGSPSKAGARGSPARHLRMGGKGNERAREGRESSPLRSSPSRVSRRGSSPTASTMEMDDEEQDVDWEGDGEREETDQRGELLYQLFNHTPLSSYQPCLLSYTTEPSLYRILTYHPPIQPSPNHLHMAEAPGSDLPQDQSHRPGPKWGQKYTMQCYELLKTCGTGEMDDFAVLAQGVVRCLGGMLEALISAILSDWEKHGEDEDKKDISYYEITALSNLYDLLSSLAHLFPLIITYISEISVIIPATQRLVVELFSKEGKLEEMDARLKAERKRERRGGRQEKMKMDEAEGEGKKNEDENEEEEEQESEEAKMEGRVFGAWGVELGDGIAGLCEAMCWYGDGPGIWQGSELVDIILGLTSPPLDNHTVRRGLEVFFAAAIHGNQFASLMSPTENIPGLAQQPPLIERLSRYLISPHPNASSEEMLRMKLMIVKGMCMMAVSNTDAVVLMGSRTILVPALVLVLQEESSKIWGIHAYSTPVEDALALLHPSLSLLHQLVFPFPPFDSSSPSATLSSGSAANPNPTPQRYRLRSSQIDSDAPIGIDLVQVLQQTSQIKEFNGLQHMFVSAMGCMAYGIFGEGIGSEEGVGEADLRAIQVLSGDLLENVVEGPEGDVIYELYVPNEGAPPGGTEGDGDKVQVDEDVYQEMDVDEG
ncbi:hypothetical protein I312_104120 [Cryptococcus bacillisporus CA1280]|uniref:uncharacterized protein n=1 Tax=Cryptococcus bacillisporus CA1280 TaxID=1296109 RepID=UPI003367A96B